MTETLNRKKPIEGNNLINYKGTRLVNDWNVHGLQRTNLKNLDLTF